MSIFKKKKMIEKTVNDFQEYNNLLLEKNSLAIHNSKLCAEIESMRISNNDLKNEITKLKKLIRKQNAADLLVNSLIALGVFPKPKPDYDPYEEQKRLISMQQSAMAQQAAYHGALNGLGGIGNIYCSFFK